MTDLPLPVHDGTNTQFIFDEIAKAFIDTGGRQVKVRFGTSSVTWTAANISAIQTVAHGMGSTPVVVIIGNRLALTIAGVYSTTTVDATNISFKAYNSDGTVVTGTQNCYWLALG